MMGDSVYFSGHPEKQGFLTQQVIQCFLHIFENVVFVQV